MATSGPSIGRAMRSARWLLDLDPPRQRNGIALRISDPGDPLSPEHVVGLLEHASVTRPDRFDCPVDIVNVHEHLEPRPEPTSMPTSCSAACAPPRWRAGMRSAGTELPGEPLRVGRPRMAAAIGRAYHRPYERNGLPRRVDVPAGADAAGRPGAAGRPARLLARRTVHRRRLDG